MSAEPTLSLDSTQRLNKCLPGLRLSAPKPSRSPKIILEIQSLRHCLHYKPGVQAPQSEPRPIAHCHVGVDDAQYASLLSELEHLLVERSLQPVGNMTGKRLEQANWLFSQSTNKTPWPFSSIWATILAPPTTSTNE